ncbi:anthocyanidin 3-O-glucosyltransferase 6-like [Pistacia vera]|uniref:anthocyanidin 3-O-glucosyltransferase 6-like n=1 Tax=Pistacia vera TaxID=55513 RepID=UPI0012638162|nr:anthocyanidin 3-O-glucosyltransferase 6-like [Pistacia vera]
MVEFIDSHKTCVKEAIVKHVISSSNSATLAGLVVDMSYTSMIDVGNELGVPSYLFFPSTAAFLGLMLYLPTRHDEVGRGFEEFDAFQELESHAVKSLLNDFDHMPPIYTVGPIIDVKGRQSDETEKADEIMKWLDDQPDSSVVFLCFGSPRSFSEEQVKEIGFGLEQSRVRFLWSLRKPPPNGEFEGPSDYNSDNLQEILPNGFLERTKEKGLVCGRAPQKEVLAHKSVGGFVSRCGWNSILESLWFGVPIVTWPMYVKQQLNAFRMVKDLGLAVELRVDYRITNGEVALGDEIGRAIKCVMESDNEVRKKVKVMSEKSRLAVMEGGSSFAAFGHFIDDVLGNMS